MNAFLSVKLTSLPIQSLHDILTMDYGLAIWKDSAHEGFLKNAQKDSIQVSRNHDYQLL